MTEEKSGKRKSAAYKKLRRRKITLGIFGTLIFISICIFSPLFNVSEVSVSGTNVLSPEDVLRASGIKKGDNFLFVDTDESEAAINALGYVDKVEVKRKFFTRIEIEVTEATEIAYVAFSGNYVGVDEKGKILSITKSSELTPKKTVVSGLGIKTVKRGKYMESGDKTKLEAVKEMLHLLREKELLSEITKMDVQNINSISLTLTNKTRILLGDEKELDYKLEYAKAILDTETNMRGGSIDISNPSNVIYHPEEGGN